MMYIGSQLKDSALNPLYPCKVETKDSLTQTLWYFIMTTIPLIEYELVVINMGKEYTVEEAENVAKLHQGFIPTKKQLRNNFAQAAGMKEYVEELFTTSNTRLCNVAISPIGTT